MPEPAKRIWDTEAWDAADEAFYKSPLKNSPNIMALEKALGKARDRFMPKPSMGTEILGERGAPYPDIGVTRPAMEDQIRSLIELQNEQPGYRIIDEFGGPPGYGLPDRQIDPAKAQPFGTSGGTHELRQQRLRAGLPPDPHEYSPLIEKLLARETPGRDPFEIWADAPDEIPAGRIVDFANYLYESHPRNRQKWNEGYKYYGDSMFPPDPDEINPYAPGRTPLNDIRSKR